MDVYNATDLDVDYEIATSLQDVLGVNLFSHRVRILATGKTLEAAEAFISLAVMRRGVEEEFFVAVTSGSYAEGETWEGERGTAS